MKEIKTKALRDTPKAKDRGSPLSDQLKKEIRHAAVSQIQTGEEQENASAYANDKVVKAADRVVSEASHGISVAMDAGKHLFIGQTRKESQASPAADVPPSEWEMPPEPEPAVPPAYAPSPPVQHTHPPDPVYQAATEWIEDSVYPQPPVSPQAGNTPPIDFKGRDSSIRFDTVPTRSGNPEISTTPQTGYQAAKEYAQQSSQHLITESQPAVFMPEQNSAPANTQSPAMQSHSPRFVEKSVIADKTTASTIATPVEPAKAYAKQALIEQKIKAEAAQRELPIPSGQAVPEIQLRKDQSEPLLRIAEQDRLFANAKETPKGAGTNPSDAVKAFAKETSIKDITGKRTTQESTLKLRIEEEGAAPRLKIKGSESAAAPAQPTITAEKQVEIAKETAMGSIRKEATKKSVKAPAVTAHEQPILPLQAAAPPVQKPLPAIGNKKLLPQMEKQSGAKAVKKAAAPVFGKSGKQLKIADSSIKTAKQASAQTKAAAEMAKTFAVQAEQSVRTFNLKKSVEAAAAFAEKAAQKAARVAKAIAQATRELISALAAGGGTLLIIVVILVVMGFAGMMFASDDDDIEIIPISDEVKAYEPIIQKYAKQYGIGEYVLLIEAVMMQESGGRTTAPMQCSECNFNTRYPHAPDSITDPEYSVEVGVQNLADCLEIAGCESPIDMDHIKLALQGYNYGQGYITWALNKYGEYSKANAIEFSIKTAEQFGWSSYGDKDYVPHVLRYYPLGQIFYDTDTSTLIVEVAASQIGNVGGEPYWRWYGFTDHVEWCACFVSWCADQCGYLDTAIPKYAGCVIGANWFKGRNQWADRSVSPEPGMIIFFDWGGDGIPDHTGIVEKCENGYVYTIEGNSSDSCRQRSYPVGYYQILGYGIPDY